MLAVNVKTKCKAWYPQLLSKTICYVCLISVVKEGVHSIQLQQYYKIFDALAPFCIDIKYAVNTRTGHEGSEMEQRYNCPLPLASVPGGRGRSKPRPPGSFTPRKETGQQFREDYLCPRTRVNGCGKCYPPMEFDPLTVQPVASRYTDRTVAAHTVINSCRF